MNKFKTEIDEKNLSEIKLAGVFSTVKNKKNGKEKSLTVFI